MSGRSLSEDDITSRRLVSRRTLLRSVGVGAAAVATIVGAKASENQSNEPSSGQKPRPADPCRDTDRHVNDQDGGCPGKPIA